MSDKWVLVVIILYKRPPYYRNLDDITVTKQTRSFTKTFEDCTDVINRSFDKKLFCEDE